MGWRDIHKEKKVLVDIPIEKIENEDKKPVPFFDSIDILNCVIFVIGGGATIRIFEWFYPNFSNINSSMFITVVFAVVGGIVVGFRLFRN